MHLELEELVAIKLMSGEAARDPGAQQRFLREARAVAKLKGEHVVRVLDVARLPDGAPFIVMEHLGGQTLRALLRSRGRLPWQEAASLVVQACEGLAEAHARGMVHRDLKLANMMLCERHDGGSILKILDFGLVKVTDPFSRRAPSPTLTGSNDMLGSLHYMAPEQLQ